MKRVINTPPIIYNLFPRLTGPFSQWSKHFERAKNLNFNWIFINPIQLPGLSGSMYSIKDYFKIDPYYLEGNEPPEQQVKKVIRQIHSLDLRVMIDLVINHTAIDSVLVKEHPDWFKYNENKEIVNPRAMNGDQVVAVWGDLAEIDNLTSPDCQNLWQYWENVISYLIDLGFDGFRCDAAYQVPTILWKRLIPFAKNKHSDILFFAESLGCPFENVLKLGQIGFDFTFNSSKYWDFEADWALEQYDENRQKGAPSISFAESHDTIRLAAEMNGNWLAVKMRYLFSVIFSSGVMMPIGFEFGFQKQLHVVNTTFLDWEKTAFDLQNYIRHANQIKLSHSVFGEESRLIPLKNINQKILSFIKISHNEKEIALILINKDLISTQKIDFKKNYTLKELFNQLNPVLVENDFERDAKDLIILRPAGVVILWGKLDSEKNYKNIIQQN
jgi:starch synthase (maltosyl-transferring)